MAVEKVGSYISCLTIVKNQKLVKEQITSLSSGVIKTEIIEGPKPFVRNNQVYIKIKAKINVDSNILEKQVEALLQDKKILIQLEKERRKRIELEKKIESLTSDNADIK